MKRSAASLAILALLTARTAAAQPAADPRADLAQPDAPPNPPAPGARGADKALEPLAGPRVEADPGGSKLPPLAGYADGFFLRDPSDTFIFYPRGRLQLDLHTFPGAAAAAPGSDRPSVDPRFAVRRARVELAGELLRRWYFVSSFDVSTLALESDNLTLSEGSDPNTPRSNVVLSQAWLNYGLIPAFNLKLGQFATPYGLENTTDTDQTALMERNLAIRGFVVPSPNELGLSAWGEVLDRRLSYEIGVFLGDGQNRAFVDANPDFAARVYTRPFHREKSSAARGLQIGVSGRVGWRAQGDVAYRYPALVSGQGYPLWDGRYVDSYGRQVVTIPSGTQGAFGGEIRVPIGPIELRTEIHGVLNQTREAIGGLEKTNTERLGSVEGVGWYVQVTGWLLDAFVSGEPGTLGRPRLLDFKMERDGRRPEIKRGIELTLLGAGVHASVKGGSRGGVLDAKTPGAPGGPSGDLTVLQFGAAASYWHSRHVRLTVNYSAYFAPKSGSLDNLAVVPQNVAASPDLGEHVLHELGARAQVSF